MFRFFFSSLFLFYFNFLRNTRILPHHSYLPLFITFHHITLLHSFCQQHFILTHNTNPYLFSLFAALCLAVDLLLYLLFFLFIKSKIKLFCTLTNFPFRAAPKSSTSVSWLFFSFVHRYLVLCIFEVRAFGASSLQTTTTYY